MTDKDYRYLLLYYLEWLWFPVCVTWAQLYENQSPAMMWMAMAQSDDPLIIRCLNKKIIGIFLIFLQENIYFCGYSLEVPAWSTSNEYPQDMFLWRNKKNIDLLFCILFYN